MQKLVHVLDGADLTLGCVLQLEGVVFDAFSKFVSVVAHLVSLVGEAGYYLGCVVSAFELYFNLGD